MTKPELIEMIRQLLTQGSWNYTMLRRKDDALANLSMLSKLTEEEKAEYGKELWERQQKAKGTE